ncbi:MAG: proline dehydrogenase family protein [Propionibacteriaceae bacterium]|jgi:proline dehydrogenase|nr:proline dehydrogenase family protein [Propionibacteriaceae bacterium]
MIRKILLTMARSTRFRDLLVKWPVTSDVVKRFIIGTTWDEALPGIRELVDKGLNVTIDLLGEDVTDAAQAESTVQDYLRVLDAIAAEGMAEQAEMSIKLTALGMDLEDGEATALKNATRIAEKAHAVGTTLTVDMEDHTTTDQTIRVVEALRQSVPDIGCVLQASLKRTEFDCARLDGPQSRTRLCKGAYASPATVAYQDRHDVDLSFVRCLKVLMRGEGRPLVATHDPDLIEIAQELASRTGRGLKDFEFQMLYGIRPLEQERLANLGHTVRVYTPFGPDWYGYFVRRLAERPANLMFFLRSFLTKK